MNHEVEQDYQDLHGWFNVHIAIYLADGLSADERERFESHAGECESCASELARARADDDALRSAFTADARAADFEDRMIDRFRSGLATRRRFALRSMHPFVRHAATAAAASFLVATVGYLGSTYLDHQRSITASNLQAIGQSLLSYSNASRFEFGGGANSKLGWSNWRDAAATQPATPARTGINEEIDGDGDLDATKKAAVQLRARLHAEESSKRETVLDLIRTTRQYVEQANYDQALGIVDQILVIDPQNDYAGGVKPLIEARIATAREQRKDILRYPEKWPELSEQSRGKGEALERGELIVNRQAAQQLDRALPEINFNQIALTDVVEYLRDVTQANIVVNWQALERAGINRNTPVTKQLKNVTLSNAVQTILDDVSSRSGARLAYAIDDGVISISTTGDLAKSSASPTSQPAIDAAEGRAIIRTGTIEFEIDNFESTFEQIKKITEGVRGYVGTINSERLTNGKVRGTITLRVPPDRTEDVIGKLRPLGTIVRQNLAAEEVTRQLADLSRQLETAQTMQQRFTDLSGGSTTQPVKDRVQAEREAGEWRAKAEQAQSQIASLKNQVSLATITVILNEKGLQGSAVLNESETVELNAQTEDVERVRNDAIKVIDETNGRIVESSLKQFDAGQLAARVVAEVSSERASEVINRLKQLGKVARLDVQRSSTTPDNRPAAPGTRVERKDTRIVVSFYNLANVSPRLSSTVNLACDDVESAYRAIAERVGKANGRVISSNVNRQQSDRASATIHFEVKSDQADAMLNDLRTAGELMKLESVQNTDTNNVTDAKRGFTVQLVSTASAVPRQVTTRSLAANEVAAAYSAVLDVANQAKARIVVSKLEQNANQPTSAWLDFEVRRDDVAAIDAAIAGAGDVIGGDVTVSSDASNTLASKVQYKVALSSADQLPPRETIMLAIETRDVEASAAAMTKAASDLGGRAITSDVMRDPGHTSAHVTIDVPLAKSSAAIERAKSSGTVKASQSATSAQTANGGQLARARIDVTFATPDTIVGADAGFGASIRNGLATSAAGLMWSLRLLVIGVCLIAPWAIAVWGGWKVARRVRARRVTA